MNHSHQLINGERLDLTPEEIAQLEQKDASFAFNQSPSTVTMRQGRLALLQAGLLAQVQSIIDTQGEAEKIEWEYAQTIDRDSPLVAALAAALSLDDAALDALFISASNL